MIGLKDLVGIADRLQTGLMNEHSPICKALHGRWIVRYKDDCAAFFSAFLKMGEAFLGKKKIADGKDLIQKQDGRLDLHGNGKGQANGHSAGVVLDL